MLGMDPDRAAPGKQNCRCRASTGFEDHRGRRLCLVAVYVVETLGTKFQRHGQKEFCAWISVKDLQVSL